MQGKQQAGAMEQAWRTEPRWQGIERPYSTEDVLRLRGSVRIESGVWDPRRDRLLWDRLTLERSPAMREAGIKG